MLNLAPIRYAKVMHEDSGPISRLEHAQVDVFGAALIHAVTYLNEEIVKSGYIENRVTDQPDGAGCHSSVQIACHMAISEALERWAVYYCRERSDSGLGGINIDGSSNGFAAFPGLFKRQARKAAFREAIERHCLISWWEGLLGHQCIEDPCPGISALVINNPFSSHSIVLIWSILGEGYSYAFGAGNNITHATDRALVELSRTQQLIKQLSSKENSVGGDVFERRIRFFASEEGAALFLKRLSMRVSKQAPKMKLLFDEAVRGPWDKYASVWRTIIEAPSKAYLTEAEDYFFW